MHARLGCERVHGDTEGKVANRSRRLQRKNQMRRWPEVFQRSARNSLVLSPVFTVVFSEMERQDDDGKISKKDGHRLATPFPSSSPTQSRLAYIIISFLYSFRFFSP